MPTSQRLLTEHYKGKNKMNLREKANTVEEKRTLNIADLEKFDVNSPIENRTYEDKDGKEFSFDVIIVDEVDYRVPTSVLLQLKEQLAERPEITHAKVKKSGEGLNTKYTVIVVD